MSGIYGYRWQVASKRFLRSNPLCEHCGQRGQVTLAQCVDHRKPHKGDEVLFWYESNWSPLCNRCHSVKTTTADRGKPLGRPKTRYDRNGRRV